MQDFKLYIFCIIITKSLTFLQQFSQAIIIMKIDIDDYENLVIIATPRTVDLPIKTSKSLKHDIKFIVSCKESLAEYK